MKCRDRIMPSVMPEGRIRPSMRPGGRVMPSVQPGGKMTPSEIRRCHQRNAEVKPGHQDDKIHEGATSCQDWSISTMTTSGISEDGEMSPSSTEIT